MGIGLIAIIGVNFVINLVPILFTLKNAIWQLVINCKRRKAMKLIREHLNHRTDAEKAYHENLEYRFALAVGNLQLIKAMGIEHLAGVITDK